MSREPSIEVKPEWKLQEQIELTQIQKLKSEVPQAEDLVTCGGVEYYDRSYDSITVKTRKPLQRIDRTTFRVTTTDDPIIKKLSLEESFQGNAIFGTDAILALLMTSPRSVYSWDIVVRRVGSRLLFFDKRDNSQFDQWTVNETATEPPSEDHPFNTPSRLAREATYINQNFAQQLVQRGGEKYSFSEPNPFQSGQMEEELASVGYRYRKWDLGDGNTLICRCEVDAAIKKEGKDTPEFAILRALNEYEGAPKASGGVDWRQKLDVQRASVLASELKNNASKLARWTAQAILAGAQQLKLGFVTRTNMKDPMAGHQILGVHTYNPAEFAHQINLTQHNLWGIFKHLIDICMDLEEGTYVLLKDPNKGLLRLYSVPEGTLEEEKVDEDEEESDEADGEEDGDEYEEEEI